MDMHKLALLTKARGLAARLDRSRPVWPLVGSPMQGYHLGNDNRVAYPDTVWYDSGGSLLPLPPVEHDVPWKILVLDLAGYDYLCAAGLVYAPEHTGHLKREVVDNRRAPGG